MARWRRGSSAKVSEGDDSGIEGGEDAVIDAEIVEPLSAANGDGLNLIQQGRYDLGEKHLFRDVWFVLFYLGFAMPFAFVGYWGRSLGMAEFGLDKYVATTMFMLVQIPFFLRLVWAVPIERHDSMSLGRRRTWMLAGSVGHIVILLPLLLIDVAASPWLWIALVAFSLVPRLFAEQATAAMMAESVPQLGRANSMINLAYRGGPHALMLLMGWWVAGGDASPFSNGGLIDYVSVRFASAVLLLAAMLSGIGITLLMREGRTLHGPRASEEEPPQAATLAEAAANPTLRFPEDVGWLQRLIAAMRTKTQWWILVACVLLPLGDGFEAWFTAFLVEIGEMDGPEITKWINIFAFVNYLGLAGPWLSDRLGRRRMLRLFAIGSLICYIALGVGMLSRLSTELILLVWMPTLVLTDMMMFTFITTWADVADARLGATHMGLYQTVQAVSATFVMVGLGGLLLYASGDAYGVLFLAAAIGPLLGLYVFSKLRLGDDLGSDPIDLNAAIERWQNRALRLPWAPKDVGSESNRSGASRAVAIAAILMLLPAVAAVPALNWDEDTTEEEWRGHWVQQSFETEIGNTISTGSSIEARVEMDRGGVTVVNYSVTYEGDDAAAGLFCDPIWRVELSVPNAIEHSDGSNSTRWEQDMFEGSAQSIVGTPEPNLTAESSDSLQSKVTALRADPGWMWGKGEYLLTLRYLDNDGTCPSNEASWVLLLNVSQWREPLFVDGEFEVEITEQAGGEHRYGTAIGALIGLPVLTAAPAVAWLVGRDPESPFG